MRRPTDPKQAIYRFRGADIDVYREARDNISGRSGGAIVQVTANFRSRRGIIAYVNDRFEAVLSQPAQPGYVALTPTVEDDGTRLPCVARITIDLPPGESPDAQRDAEAEAVAETCRRLIGAFEITRADGSRSLTQPGDIALLAPTGTELWRYERALEAQRIAVASQAGKTLMRRQETQDILVLLRTLSDSRDTLALGALLRGPLVGLTDDELLRIAAELPEGRELSLRTDPEAVHHQLARSVLETLRELRRKAPATTPSLLLSEAVEQLHIRVVLAARHRNRSSRALANVDALIERARAYDVSGLQTLVHDLQRDWERQTRLQEGRSDTSEDAVELVTMHSSKGLEWPIVVPINTVTRFRGADEFVHRRSDDTLHWVLGGVPPPHLATAREEENVSEARQRERLWYVACTRARDLLVVPSLPSAEASSWSRIVDLDHASLPELNLGALPPPAARPDGAVTNDQTAARFAAEAETIAAASTPLVWRRPSDHDPDRASTVVGAIDPANETAEIDVVAGAGPLRGIVLHKLMEEFLTGELAEDEIMVAARGGELLAQLVPDKTDRSKDLPQPKELATTALRTLRLPDINALRTALMPEIAIWSAPADELLAGRADATAYDGDTPTVVLDWKSDIAPTVQDRAQHRGQLQEYMEAIGAGRGAVVYMSLGEMAWVELEL